MYESSLQNNLPNYEYPDETTLKNAIETYNCVLRIK